MSVSITEFQQRVLAVFGYGPGDKVRSLTFRMEVGGWPLVEIVRYADSDALAEGLETLKFTLVPKDES